LQVQPRRRVEVAHIRPDGIRAAVRTIRQADVVAVESGTVLTPSCESPEKRESRGCDDAVETFAVVNEAPPAGQRTIEALWGETREPGAWDFSTNGTYWAGKAGIPAIGFGPGDEKTAHMRHENVPLQEVVAATQFYALLPYFLQNSV
jgi:acetylornithine deacetylase/succinyl-diaminopimelate desuccinylase-like protein